MQTKFLEFKVPVL